MKELNWDNLSMIVYIKNLLIKANKELKSNNSCTFKKVYVFKHGLRNKHEPLRNTFVKDMENWISSWEETKSDYELFHAKITIVFTDKYGNLSSVTDNHKFYTDSLLPSDSRLLKWKSFLLLTTMTHRNITQSSIREVHVDLEWYNYLEDIRLAFNVISHGKPSLEDIELPKDDNQSPKEDNQSPKEDNQSPKDDSIS